MKTRNFVFLSHATRPISQSVGWSVRFDYCPCTRARDNAAGNLTFFLPRDSSKAKLQFHNSTKYVFIQSFIHSFIQRKIRTKIFIHFCHIFINSFVRSFNHSFIQLLTFQKLLLISFPPNSWGDFLSPLIGPNLVRGRITLRQ